MKKIKDIMHDINYLKNQIENDIMKFNIFFEVLTSKSMSTEFSYNQTMEFCIETSTTKLIKLEEVITKLISIEYSIVNYIFILDFKFRKIRRFFRNRYSK
jgi:hypothetical protein